MKGNHNHCVMPEWFYRAPMQFSLGAMLFPGFPLKARGNDSGGGTCGNDRGGEHAGMPPFSVMPEWFYRASMKFLLGNHDTLWIPAKGICAGVFLIKPLPLLE